MNAHARLRALRAQAAAVALVDIGRAHGLFARLGGLPPSSRTALAAAASVDERWLGDWLDGLVLAGLVDHDGTRGTYAIDAALAAAAHVDDDHTAALREAARARHPRAVVVDVAADPLEALRAARARVASGTTLAAAVIAACARVSDNLDHPLGPALYLRSLEGRGGVVDEHALRSAAEGAGLRDVRTVVVTVGALEFLVLAGRA